MDGINSTTFFQGLETLQAMQICHRDLSPENMIILDNKTLVIDFGMCLRIPYTSAGRHLITPQTPCGKLVCVVLRNISVLYSFGLIQC